MFFFPVVSIFHLQSSQFRRCVVEVIVEGYFLKPDEVGLTPLDRRVEVEGWYRWWGSKVVVFKTPWSSTPKIGSPLFFSKTKKTGHSGIVQIPSPSSKVWCSCWWFRNPKQPPGIYETLVQQSWDLIFLQVNIPPLSDGDFEDDPRWKGCGFQGVFSPKSWAKWSNWTSN